MDLDLCRLSLRAGSRFCSMLEARVAGGKDGGGALRSACRPGASTREICRVYQSCGEADPELPILYGVGLGLERPVAGASGDPEEASLEVGHVIAVYSDVSLAEFGSVFSRDTLVIRESGAEVLNAIPG